MRGKDAKERAKTELDALLGAVLAGVAGKTEEYLFLPALWDSYLGEGNQEQLFLASVFPSPVPRRAIEMVWGKSVSDSDLEEMVATTFLETWRQDELEWYAMHPVVRDFMHRKHRRSGSSLIEAHRAAARYYEGTQRQTTGLGDAIAARWHWLQAESWDDAARWTLTIADFLHGRGQWPLAQRLIGEILACAVGELPRAGLLNIAGVLLNQQGKPEEAETAHSQALEIARRLNNPDTEASALGNMGNIYARQGKLEEAERARSQGLEIARRLGNPELKDMVLMFFGDLDLRSQEARLLDSAVTRLVAALLILSSLDSPSGRAAVRHLIQAYARFGHDSFCQSLEMVWPAIETEVGQTLSSELRSGVIQLVKREAARGKEKSA